MLNFREIPQENFALRAISWKKNYFNRIDELIHTKQKTIVIDFFNNNSSYPMNLVN